MNKKKKILLISLVFILISVIGIVFFITRSKDYSIEYDKKAVIVKETYRDKMDMYYISVLKDNILYEYGIKSDYKGKIIVDKLKVAEEEEYSCVEIASQKVKVEPVCYKDGEMVLSSLIDEEFYKYNNVKNNNIKYGKFDIKSLFNNNYAVWNNKGYTFISKKKQKEVTFLDEELYYDNLSYQVGKYILIPDYNQKYEFDKFYILNMDNGKLKEWKLDIKLSFNIYYLGVHKNKLYLVDRKNIREYVLDVKKKKLEDITTRELEGKVYDNGWKNVSMKKLVSEDYVFIEDEMFTFLIKENKLYMKYFRGTENILISNREVEKIVKKDADTVYYLSKGILYCYSPNYGEVELIGYSEWNFNKENPIYIY